MTTATLTLCESCGTVRISAAGIAMRATTVPGTGDMSCGHVFVEVGTIRVPQIVHVALSTIIRDGRVDQSARDTAHIVQDWLNVSHLYRRTSGIPWMLVDDYGVSSTGLAVARILARAVSAASVPSDAVYWSAAANVMRRKI